MCNVAKVRADLAHERRMAELTDEFAAARLELIAAVKEDEADGSMTSDQAARWIARCDQERAEYLERAAEHRRRAHELEHELAAAEAV